MNILILLQRLVYNLISILEWMLIARAILSWFPNLHGNAIVGFLFTITEYMLAPIRSVLMRVSFFRSMPIDFSFIVAWILLDMIRNILL